MFSFQGINTYSICVTVLDFFKFLAAVGMILMFETLVRYLSRVLEFFTVCVCIHTKTKRGEVEERFEKFLWLLLFLLSGGAIYYD